MSTTFRGEAETEKWKWDNFGGNELQPHCWLASLAAVSPQLYIDMVSYLCVPLPLPVISCCFGHEFVRCLDLNFPLSPNWRYNII